MKQYLGGPAECKGGVERRMCQVRVLYENPMLSRDLHLNFSMDHEAGRFINQRDIMVDSR